MRLDRESQSEAEDAEEGEAISDETPDGDDAERDDEFGRVGEDDQDFAVCEQIPDEGAAEDRGVICAQIHGEKRSDYEAEGTDQRPEHMSGPPRQESEGEHGDEGGGRVNVAGGNGALKGVLEGSLAAFCPVGLKYLVLVVRVGVTEQSACGVVVGEEIEDRAR